MFNGVNMKHLVELQKQQDQLELPKMDTSHEEKDEEEVDVIEEKDEDEDVIDFRKSISPSAFSSLLSSLFLGVSNRLADSTSSNASLAANVLCSFPLLLACPSDLCSVSSILSLHIDDERESVRLACRDTLVSFITLLGHPLNSVDYESILTHLPHGCVPTCMLLDDYWIPVMDAKRKELFAECIKEYEKRKVKARNTKAIETIDAVIARYSSK
eukprot:gnl/Carplike_NY0171/6323_a8692_178.p1 GENE.gnl/Carplike_NY0171/6323_a8692_178~~gnl/Carplike_NY0171/6323_a8692_178.p1  ORF type:complete len:248 (-),score=94.22 gnl/Carplike_NY0171/6323_a8692_178:239-880(-)